MKQEIEKVFDQARSAWRYRWWALLTACLVVSIGWVVVFALPDRYMAQASVFVDTRTALKPALQGLTTDQNVDGIINYVRQSLLEGPNLEGIARDTGVLPPIMIDEGSQGKVLSEFASRMVLNVSSAGNQGDERSTAGTMYDFYYSDTDRGRALKVVKKVLDRFVEDTLGGKREGSEQAQQFLAAQIKDYEQRLSSAEDRLAKFKKENVGLMPSDQGGYFAQLQSETDAEKKAETELSVALSRRDELNRQLHSDEAISAAGASASGTGGAVVAGSDTLSRIQQGQARLDELRLKFTERHPDVIAAKATLDELKLRRSAELQSLKQGDASAVASSGAGNNPVYQNIELALNREDVEVAALRRALSQHRATVAELRTQLNSAPQVEAQFQQLNRDYDVNKAQYTALLESYQKARLGERADNAGSVRFEVVLPPTAATTPVWPKRLQLLAGVFLGGIAAGAGVAFVLHLLKPVVSSVLTINEMTPLPVLGTVSFAYPSVQRRKARASFAKIAFSALCLVAAFMMVLVLSRKGARLDVDGIRATASNAIQHWTKS